MWAVLGVWEIDGSLLEGVRLQIPEMAYGEIGTRGLLHGTWTRDGHVMMVFADEQAARRYHGDMLTQGAVDRLGLRSIVWDVAARSDPGPVPDGRLRRNGYQRGH